MPVVRELITRWGFDVDEQTLNSMDQRVRKLRGGFLKVGAAGAAAFGGLAIPAARLEAAIRQTLTATNSQVEGFDQVRQGLTDRALQLSSDMNIAATQVADGFFQVLSTGTQALTPEFDALADTGLRLAKVFGFTVDQSVETLADTLGGFNLSMTEAGRVADVFSLANRQAQLTVNQLAEAMTEAAPAAGKVGQSLEDTTALINAMATSGVKGRRAGTALRIVFSRLAKEGTPAADAIADLGVRTQDSAGNFRNILDILQDMRVALRSKTQAEQASILSTIAGEEAFTKLAAILQVSDEQLRQWSGDLQNAAGTLDDAFNQKMQSATEQGGRLLKSLVNLAATLGAPFLGPLASIAESLANVTTRFQEVAAAHPVIGTTIGLVALLAAGVGALGVVVTTAALLFIPLTKAIAAAKAAVIGFGIAQSLATGAAVTFKGALIGLALTSAKTALAFLASWVIIPGILAGILVLIIDDIVAFFRGDDSVSGAFGDWLWENVTLPFLNWSEDLLDKIRRFFSETVPAAIGSAGRAVLEFLGIETPEAGGAGRRGGRRGRGSIAQGIADQALLEAIASNTLPGAEQRAALAGDVGRGGGSVQLTQDVTVQVPPGTDEQQAAFLQNQVREIMRQEGERAQRKIQNSLGAGRTTRSRARANR